MQLNHRWTGTVLVLAVQCTDQEWTDLSLSAMKVGTRTDDDVSDLFFDANLVEANFPITDAGKTLRDYVFDEHVQESLIWLWRAGPDDLDADDAMLEEEEVQEDAAEVGQEAIP